jgi:DNA-binding response OmpR family regulator
MKTRLLLHADDDANWAFLVERALMKSELRNWQYQHLSSGVELSEFLTNVKLRHVKTPDLLVLDIRMPGMDGLQVLEWTNSNIPGLPVVMLSSSELLGDRLKARDLGSKGYFTKATVFSEFVEFLRGWEETAFAVNSSRGEWQLD